MNTVLFVLLHRNALMLAIYYLLPTTYYLLPTTYYLLYTA